MFLNYPRQSCPFSPWFPSVLAAVQRHRASRETAFPARTACCVTAFRRVLAAAATASVASVSYQGGALRRIFIKLKTPLIPLSSSDLWRCDTRELHVLCEPQSSGCLRRHRKLPGDCPETPPGYLSAAPGLGYVFDSPSGGSQSSVQSGSVTHFGRQSHTHDLRQLNGRSQ